MIVARAGLEPVRCASTATGLRVDELARGSVDAVVVTPAHQSPTGAVLSRERRTALLAWLRDTDAIAIEDDYDAEYRYDRAAVGALQGLEPEHVVYAGTAQKTLAPGAAHRLARRARRAARAVRRRSASPTAAPPHIDQRAFAELLTRGELDRHLRRMRQPLPRPARRARRGARRGAARGDRARDRGRACTPSSSSRRRRRGRRSVEEAARAGSASRRSRDYGAPAGGRRPYCCSATARSPSPRSRRGSGRSPRRCAKSAAALLNGAGSTEDLARMRVLQWIRAHDPGWAALRRAGRTAVVMPAAVRARRPRSSANPRWRRSRRSARSRCSCSSTSAGRCATACATRPRSRSPAACFVCVGDAGLALDAGWRPSRWRSSPSASSSPAWSSSVLAGATTDAAAVVHPAGLAGRAGVVDPRPARGLGHGRRRARCSRSRCSGRRRRATRCAARRSPPAGRSRRGCGATSRLARPAREARARPTPRRSPRPTRRRRGAAADVLRHAVPPDRPEHRRAHRRAAGRRAALAARRSSSQPCGTAPRVR